MDFSRLNSAQKDAVLHGAAPLLVLAGAGTGKTQVITYRIAQLIFSGQARTDQIFAATFTNKAARQMRERAAQLIGVDPRLLDIGTFHSQCGRLLRTHGAILGLSPRFVIYDEDDQLQLIKKCMQELNISSETFAPRAIRHHIEQWKNQGLLPDAVTPTSFDLSAKRAADVYHLYRKKCLKLDVIDFGDLLLHTLTLLRMDEDLKNRLQRRWTHLFVDEYQDTNPVQYLLLRELVGPQSHITVVGDDDQAIYRWRGADIGNILRFERDFPGARIIRLEENYRSHQTILSAANAVIAHNSSRKGKTLFSTRGEGEAVRVRVFVSERDEGQAIAQAIADELSAGTVAHEVAILYRTNAQSRPLEDALRGQRIPYAIYGGMRFYDRKEIKDGLAYLRLLVNPRSDADFYRVINEPARGIGKVSLERVEDIARQQESSMYEAATHVARGAGELTPKVRKKIDAFTNVVEHVRREMDKRPPSEILTLILEDSGYLQSLRAEATEEASGRLENLSELVAALEEYFDEAVEPSLAGFLEDVALVTDVDGMTDASAKVSLMTLHAAKGLEFESVFLAGMEEGIFPHNRSLDDRAALEEERRLCYVGITRAKSKLMLSAARVRHIFGEPRYAELSRFVGELPPEYIDFGPAPQPRANSFVNAQDHAILDPDEDEAAPSTVVAPSSFKPGTAVKHATFGVGKVLSTSAISGRECLTVDFPGVGRKVIVARYVDRL